MKPWVDTPITMTRVSAADEEIHCGHSPGTAPLQVSAVTYFLGHLADRTSQHTFETRTSVSIDTWWNYLLSYCQHVYSSAFPTQGKRTISLQWQVLTLAILTTEPSYTKSLSETFSSDMSGEDSPVQQFLCTWAEWQQLQLQSHLRLKALGLLQTLRSIFTYILKWADIQYKVCGAFILLCVCLFYKHPRIPFNRKLSLMFWALHRQNTYSCKLYHCSDSSRDFFPNVLSLVSER